MFFYPGRDKYNSRSTDKSERKWHVTDYAMLRLDKMAGQSVLLLLGHWSARCFLVLA